MARHATCGTRQLNLEIPEALDAELRALAARNGRGVKDEALHAFRRHLQTPPEVVAAPLPPATVEPAPGRRRGRPRRADGPK